MKIRDLILPLTGQKTIDSWIGIFRQMVKEINAALGVYVSASPKVGPRPEIHFVNGGNMTITAVDNPALDRIDVTLTASGGGGGGLPPDGDYGDITVSDSGAVWNLDAGVVGTTELAATSVTTAKIANDSVDNTKLANEAQATVIGRAVGAGTGDPQYLAASDLQAILHTISGYAAMYFGDGVDGALTVTTGVTVTLARPMFYSTVVVQSGGRIVTAGCPLFASVSITVDSGGRIDHDGFAASGVTAGAATSTGAQGYVSGSNGGGASSGAGAAGSNGNAPARYDGGRGGNGGAGFSAAGGTGSPNTFCPMRAFLPGFHPIGMLTSVVSAAVGSCGTGGGAGGGGGTAGTRGGAGGGGGGYVPLAAPIITNNGTISARGGAGGNAPSTNGGGGGGGGGGKVHTICRTYTGTSPDVSGGAGGLLSPGGVANGANGAAGVWLDQRI